MKVNYNGAFEAVIRQQWQDLSDEERHDAESPDRQGKLRPDAPNAHALCDTFKYQQSTGP